MPGRQAGKKGSPLGLRAVVQSESRSGWKAGLEGPRHIDTWSWSILDIEDKFIVRRHQYRIRGRVKSFLRTASRHLKAPDIRFKNCITELRRARSRDNRLDSTPQFLGHDLARCSLQAAHLKTLGTRSFRLRFPEVCRLGHRVSLVLSLVASASS